MYKIINDNNSVNYGCIDEQVDWNIDQFKLRNFFNKEIKGIKKKWAYKQFNYIGISTEKFIIGIAVVHLGFGFEIFAYHYDLKKGISYSFNKTAIGNSKKLSFPKNPDKYVIEYKDKKTELLIMKSHKKGSLEIHCNFESKLIINAEFDYSLKNQPLRVLNPSQPTNWTFTEKCSPLIPNEIDICLNGLPLKVSKSTTSAIYDWSGGFLRRETNWYWASFSGKATSGKSLGFNFAALVNESFYSENAYWIEGKRTRVPRLIFDFDQQSPYKTWQIYNEEKTIHLTFKPHGERSKKIKAIPLVKINFRQFIGYFSGWILNSDKVKEKINNQPGFCEIHRSIW